MELEEIWLKVAQANIALARESSEADPTYFYTSFTIPKRRGGWERVITTPSKALKVLQQQVLKYVLSEAQPHPQATAFFAGRNILSNAQKHHKCEFLFKSDIINFFPSIKSVGIATTIQEHFPNYAANHVDMLAQILSCNGSLPQGAPASPHISNLYMYRFDSLLSVVSSELGATYTRYADDISVSAAEEQWLTIVSDLISVKLSQLGFGINRSKTRTYRQSDRKFITGLDVSGDVIRPTKSFRKSTTAKARVMACYGRYGMANEVRGRLAFWRSICPTDPDLLAAADLFAKALAGRAQQQAARFGQDQASGDHSELPF